MAVLSTREQFSTIQQAAECFASGYVYKTQLDDTAIIGKGAHFVRSVTTDISSQRAFIHHLLDEISDARAAATMGIRQDAHVVGTTLHQYTSAAERLLQQARKVS